VAGLNPHAGEEGLFGDEEQHAILPAIEAARSEGLNVTGPLPADTLFSRARGGEFDIVVAMYHDQGHIPVKTLGFEYDEASRRKGIANHESMVEALDVATRMLTPEG
jgi:4-hydroxythreonine-4-phosphate dehydrogenase